MIIDDTAPDEFDFAKPLTWEARRRIFEAGDRAADAMHRLRLAGLRQASFSTASNPEPPQRRPSP